MSRCPVATFKKDVPIPYHLYLDLPTPNYFNQLRFKTGKRGEAFNKVLV